MNRFEAFRAIVEKHTADDLKRETAEEMHRLGVQTLDADVGAVGHILGKKVLPFGLDRDETMAVVSQLLKHYQIRADWVPVSAILRDALPHFVHLRRILMPLTNGSISKREQLLVKLGKLAREFETADEAQVVSLDWLQKQAGVWLEGQ